MKVCEYIIKHPGGKRQLKRNLQCLITNVRQEHFVERKLYPCSIALMPDCNDKVKPKQDISFLGAKEREKNRHFKKFTINKIQYWYLEEY